MRTTDAFSFLLALIVTIGFLGCMLLLMTRPETMDDSTKQMLNMLAGILGTNFGVIVTFYFGSSLTSKTKDDTISHLTAQPAAPPAGNNAQN